MASFLTATVESVSSVFARLNQSHHCTRLRLHHSHRTLQKDACDCCLLALVNAASLLWWGIVWSTCRVMPSNEKLLHVPSFTCSSQTHATSTPAASQRGNGFFLDRNCRKLFVGFRQAEPKPLLYQAAFASFASDIAKRGMCLLFTGTGEGCFSVVVGHCVVYL